MTQFINEQTVFNTPVLFAALPLRNSDKFPLGADKVSVANIEAFTTANTGAITVTEFQKGFIGQRIFILGDGFTTIQNNATIKTNTGADKLLDANKVYRFTNFNNVWIEDEGGTGGGGSFVAKSGDTMTGQLLMHDQIRIGDTGIMVTEDLKSDYLHTQMVFAAPNLNMIFLSNTTLTDVDGNGAIALRNNMFSFNGDGGWRIWQNFKQTNTGFGTDDPTRPATTTAMDSLGVLSIKYIQPSSMGASVYGGGQTLIINGAGGPGGGGAESDTITIASMQAGRFFELCTSDVINAANRVIRMKPSGVDRVEIFVDSAVRTVSSKDFSALVAGDKVLIYT